MKSRCVLSVVTQWRRGDRFGKLASRAEGPSLLCERPAIGRSPGECCDRDRLPHLWASVWNDWSRDPRHPRARQSHGPQFVSRPPVRRVSRRECCRMTCRSCTARGSRGRDVFRLHLVIQPPQPAVGHDCDYHVVRLAFLLEPGRELAPVRVVNHQTMCRLDQHHSQAVVAGLDESGIGHAFAAGGVTPQYRASCLPLSKRSNRAISARMVMAVIGSIPSIVSSRATTASSVVNRCSRCSISRIFCCRRASFSRCSSRS